MERPLASFIVAKKREIAASGRLGGGGGDDDGDDDDDPSLAKIHRDVVRRAERWILREDGKESRDDDADAVVRRRVGFGEDSRAVTEVLQRVPLFAALDRTQLMVLLREGAHVETHPPGRDVAVQGDESGASFPHTGSRTTASAL